MATNNAINAAKPIGVASGGTGAATFTSHGILYGSATAAIGATAELSNGQTLIGSTGNAAVPAVITPGSGISITNASGAITVNATTPPLVINDVGSASTYTFVAADAGALVRISGSGTTGTISVPTNASVPFAIGTHIWIFAYGTKLYTIARVSAPTLLYSYGNLVNIRNSSVAELIKFATDYWILFGNLE